ncbi:LAME_0G01816g1_1 [Lachancea meyersii CBS 8951]|uniref:Plasma membrane fusion protein PRM1 n=1 Tax=Lachancea meyersii CBS 8951 TaxID=1266667 RepID=A0A1G4K5K8_9SACH|nr:LAME_0G01816g1_1 [Lachancea meyersii CBS 8951]
MGLKPYLQLRDRISQVWLNQYTVLLLLIIVKLTLFSISLNNAIASSKMYALNSCNSIDAMYSQLMDSGPQYMCQFGNFLVEQSIKESVKATLKTVSLLVEAGEQVAIFLFDFYFGTYICLATSAVDGAVDVATNTTEKLLDVVNSTLIAVGDDIDSGLEDLSGVINKVLEAVQDVKSFFKGGSSSSDVDSSVNAMNLSIAKLRNMYIPSSIDLKLSELAHKTLNFETVMNKTHAEISVPFDLVRSKISTVNISKLLANNQKLYLPTPNASNGTSTGICSASKADIVKFYAGVSKTISVIVIILVTLLAVGAFAAMVPSVWSEYKQWTRLRRLQDISDEKTAVEGTPWAKTDVIENYQQVFDKWPFAFGKWLASKLTTSIRTRRKIRWCVAYAMSPRALTVLGIALAGLVMCICQFVLLAVAKRALADPKASQVSQAVLSAANASLHDDMARWVLATNDYINASRTQLNSEVFGWSQDATTVLNHTVAAAIDDIDTALADFFNGTLLYGPMTSVVRCTIENKLIKIQKALLWLHDNLHFPIPLIDPAAIQQWARSDNNSAQQQSQQTLINSNAIGPVTAAQKLVQTAKDALNVVLRQFYSATIFELAVALSLLGLWILQWLIAIFFTMVLNPA